MDVIPGGASSEPAALQVQRTCLGLNTVTIVFNKHAPFKPRGWGIVV